PPERPNLQRKPKHDHAKKSGKVEARASARHDKAKKGKPARPAAVAPAARVSRAKDPHADAAKLKGKEKPPRNAGKPGEDQEVEEPEVEAEVVAEIDEDDELATTTAADDDEDDDEEDGRPGT